MRWNRLDVWSGDPAEREGQQLEAALRQKTGAAVTALDGVVELLRKAHQGGRFDAGEALLGCALVREIDRLRWLLVSTLLQPSVQENESDESA